MKTLLILVALVALPSCALVPSFFESSNCPKYRRLFYDGFLNYRDLALLEKADHEMLPYPGLFPRP